MIVRETIDRRIAVEVDVQSLNGTVAGDEGQLQQVVMNLLVNARDAVLERAALNETGYAPTIRVTLRLDHLRDGRAARIEVQDNGAGMTAAVRERAFDPFFTTKPIGHGTGLGLATVAGIIEHHGGEVGLDSVPGAGTTFTVRLPLFDTERTEASTPNRTGRLAPAVTRTALVIDDEEMVRAVTTAYLEAAHYRVIALSDGNEAIRMLETGADIDIVLTDINMPSPNRWEILDRLRGKPGIPPIVVVSGYAEAEVARERGRRVSWTSRLARLNSWTSSRRSSAGSSPAHSRRAMMQRMPKERPSLKGRLLVATPLLTDPNFAGSVVLLCRHDAESAFGVILNRPLDTEAVEIVPEWAERCAMPPVLFDGGPVRRTSAMALGFDPSAHQVERGASPGWTEIQGPVGMVNLHLEPQALSASIEYIRLFAGSSGWDPDQLDREIREDAWFVVQSHASDVFTAEPHTLWREVLRRHPRYALYAFSGNETAQN